MREVGTIHGVRIMEIRDLSEETSRDTGSLRVVYTTINGVTTIYDGVPRYRAHLWKVISQEMIKKRWKSIKKRQRRAAQRRHNKGLVQRK